MEDWWYWELPEIAEGTADQQFYAATLCLGCQRISPL